MTGNNILLDTNIISALLKGEAAVAEYIDKAHQVYIPAVVIGELYFGAENSTHVDKNIANIIQLAKTYMVLSTDIDTARIYGSLKAKLKKQGTPIPENDIWIAALSEQHHLTLITRDAHFKSYSKIGYT